MCIFLLQNVSYTWFDRMYSIHERIFPNNIFLYSLLAPAKNQKLDQEKISAELFLTPMKLPSRP